MPALWDSVARALERRKGGGGHGSSGGGHSSGGGKSSSSGSSGKSSSSSGSGSSGKSSSSSSSSSKSSGSRFFPSSHPKVTKSQSFGAGVGLGVGAHHTANSYGNGQLNRGTLGSDSIYPGRDYGGVNRDGVYGTSRYGSGYAYGNNGYYVDRYPFPYVFWPVPIHHNYYCHYDCYYDHEDRRPGGKTATVPIKSKDSSITEQYRLIGDGNSVRAVLDALKSNCSIQDTSSQIATFDRDASVKSVWPEQVVQYYRSSSFALSLDSYNNTASLFSNQPKDNDTAPAAIADTPLPANVHASFLMCLNSTIAFAVPLIEADRTGLSKGAIVGIVIASILGFFLLVVALLFLIIFLRDRHEQQSWKPKTSKMKFTPFSRCFKRKSKTRYSSLETPPVPDSQNLGVNGGEKPPVFKEMVDEPESGYTDIQPPRTPTYPMEEHKSTYVSVPPPTAPSFPANEHKSELAYLGGEPSSAPSFPSHNSPMRMPEPKLS